MFATFLRFVARAQVILAVIVAVAFAAGPNVERIGDRLQVALPLLAWGCTAANKSGGEFALRFAGMWLTAHGTKRALGDAPMNMRPHGGDKGFPSAHTSASAIGASAIVHECLRGNPTAQALVIISAGFVGGSRIEAGAHTLWQVLAGALLGWGADRALRKPSRARTRVVQVLRRIAAPLIAVWAALLRLVAPLLARLR